MTQARRDRMIGCAGRLGWVAFVFTWFFVCPPRFYRRSKKPQVFLPSGSCVRPSPPWPAVHTRPGLFWASRLSLRGACSAVRSVPSRASLRVCLFRGARLARLDRPNSFRFSGCPPTPLGLRYLKTIQTTNSPRSLRPRNLPSLRLLAQSRRSLQSRPSPPLPPRMSRCCRRRPGA